MKVNQYVLTFLILLVSMFSVTQTAQAAKFGGGGSYGFSKQIAPKNFNQPKPASKPATQPQAPKNATAGNTAGQAAKTSGASRWLGPLAGFAAGGLLAAMLFGDGFEGMQLFDFLLIGLLAFLLFSLFKRRQTASPHYAGQGYDAREEADDRQPAYQQRESHTPMDYRADAQGSIIGSGLSASAHPVQDVPAWFNAAAFVDGAKSHFIAIQKAWDARDTSELQAYCTPELYAALQGEIAKLSEDNTTIVDELNAEIADMAIDGDYFIVSIRFSGFIQESREDFAHAFSEIWHIRRDASDQGNWQIAGIQQETRAE